MQCRMLTCQRLAVALVRRRRFLARRLARAALPEQTMDSGLGAGADAHSAAMGPLPDLSSEVQLTQLQP